MKRDLALLLILVLAASFLGCISSQTQTQTSQEKWLEGLKKSEFHFYIFGLNTCPHCQRMKKLLPEYFGNSSLTFYEIREDKKAYNTYMKFVKTLGITGVPLIGIFYKDNLYAVVEGEIDPKVIPQLVKEAMKNNGVILIISQGQFLVPKNESKGLELIGNMTTWFKLNGH
ncbi:thioredoxin fold domain-containing protein [Pyrococcus horikoshii]|uniref:Thioredoxin-like fold domain-containing protein n=2 Tax=Pyrococcus horikoshii TaxID=53953 RepID=O58857_PYRHO|nr:thioredoxin fold domain-containing protein [Pyrococcus horikoshii]BAA30230.1 170aa long hypothetical protein [Pyrococcus horikoshii OT3]HII61829.1 glutaredoxin [Pyrococcus horikoshii]